jgi:hypothetical protein
LEGVGGYAYYYSLFHFIQKNIKEEKIHEKAYKKIQKNKLKIN